MKVAVVGLGVMGKLHARVCHELGILKAVCDVSPAQASSIGSLWRVPSYTSVDELLLKERPLVLIVATPTPSHFSIASKAISSGCHVLVEKPICTTIVDAIWLSQLAKTKNVLLGVGYIELFNPAFNALKNLMNENVFGEITSVNIKRVGGLPRSADNIILDLMTHDFSLLIDLFGKKPDKIFAHQRRSLDGVVDSAQTLLSFGLASATCEANWVSPIKIRQIALTGTHGFCEVDLIAQTLVWTRSFSNVAEPLVLVEYAKNHNGIHLQTKASFQKEPLREEIENFVLSIESGKMDFVADGQMAIKVLETTLLAMEKGDLK